MRFTLALAAALVVATPVLAQTAPAARQGQTLRDANAARVGVIDRVNADGSVQIIFGSRFVTIPADKLVVAESGVTTTLSKRDVARIR